MTFANGSALNNQIPDTLKLTENSIALNGNTFCYDNLNISDTIKKIGSGDLLFSDQVTGTKTLAELAASIDTTSLSDRINAKADTSAAGLLATANTWTKANTFATTLYGQSNAIFTGYVQGSTLSATGSIWLSGANINTAGTLTNIAYKNAKNTFSDIQTYADTIEVDLIKSYSTSKVLFQDHLDLVSGMAFKINNTNVLRIPASSPSSICLGASGNDAFTATNNILIGKNAGRVIANTGNDNIIIGNESLYSGTTVANTIAIGYRAGYSNVSGIKNILIGYTAGYSSTTGYNCFIGYEAGMYATTGENNFAIGYRAMAGNAVSGHYNIALGGSSLFNLSTGMANAAIGLLSGYALTSGSYNTIIGTYAGRFLTGSSNIFIGYQSGYNETLSNKLYIENSSSTTPLIYGEFDTDLIKINGKLGVNVMPTEKLTVAGRVRSTNSDIVVETNGRGLILKDDAVTPHYWRITINSSGSLVITDVGTSLPAE